MSGFKQHLALAQSFQVEMADVEGVSVSASVYSVEFGKEHLGDKLVNVSISCQRNGKNEHFFQLIGDKITAESLAKLKEELKGLGYEI